MGGHCIPSHSQLTLSSTLSVTFIECYTHHFAILHAICTDYTRPCSAPSTSLNRTRFWDAMKPTFVSFTEFLPTLYSLILRQPVMLALPRMPMQCKALTLRLRNAGKHAHLNNHHSRKYLWTGHDWTTLGQHNSLTPREKRSLTFRSSRKSTDQLYSRCLSPSPRISSRRPFGLPRLPFLLQLLDLKIRTSRLLCGSWRSGTNGHAGA